MAVPSELCWAIRESFLEYVEALPDATISCSAGAQRAEHGFTFPAAEIPETESSLRFVGEVRVSAHAGALNVVLRDPHIVVDDGGAWLEITTDTGRMRPARLLDAPSLPVSERASFADVALTLDGASWLGGVYNPWTRVAPIVIR